MRAAKVVGNGQLGASHLTLDKYPYGFEAAGLRHSWAQRGYLVVRCQHDIQSGLLTLSMSQEKFMREAIKLAEAGLRGGRGGPFGCVVVRKGEIIGRGHNCVTSANDPTAHAEITAIREACD